MDDDEQWLIDHLLRPISDHDLLATIDTLVVHFSTSALPNLLQILKGENFTYAVREHAARAIAIIESSDVPNEFMQKEFTILRASASPSLMHLLDLAQGKTAA
jgi:hypothetical protein